MAHYIDKDALVAELERLYNLEYSDDSNLSCGKKIMLRHILLFLDTIEVKEVDLEKEYKDFVEEDPVYNELVNGIVGKAIAKHFFELGIKAQKMNKKK